MGLAEQARHAGVIGRQDPGGGQGLRQSDTIWLPDHHGGGGDVVDGGDGLEVSDALRSAAERDHSERLVEEVEPGLDGRDRHGRGPQVGECHAIQQMGRPQRRRVEQHVRRTDPGESPRGIARGDGGELDPDGRRALGGHQEQIALLQRYRRAGHVGCRVDIAAQAGQHGLDRSLGRQAGGDGGRVDIARRGAVGHGHAVTVVILLSARSRRR